MAVKESSCNLYKCTPCIVLKLSIKISLICSLLFICLTAIQTSSYRLAINKVRSQYVGHPRATDLECGRNFYSKSARRRVKRVAWGEPIKEGQYPWLVRLKFNGYIYPTNCGGVLIDNYHILTAARCMALCNEESYTIAPYPLHLMKVIVGDRTVSERDGEKTIKVEKGKVHDRFCTDRNDPYAYDIGIIRMEKPVDFIITKNGLGSVNRICLPEKDREYAFATNTTVTGWGQSQEYDTPDIAHKAQMGIMHYEICRDHWKSFNITFNDPRICTPGAKKDEKASWAICKGDEGSPLIMRNARNQAELVGIASIVNKRCRYAEHHNVFTKVAHHIDWISKTITNQAS